MSARLNGHVFHDDNGQNVKKKKNKILKRNDSRIPSFTQRYTQSKIAHGERKFKKKKQTKKQKRETQLAQVLTINSRLMSCVCLCSGLVLFSQSLVSFLDESSSRSPFLCLSVEPVSLFYKFPDCRAVCGWKQTNQLENARQANGEKGGRWRRRRQLLTTQRRTKGSRKQMSFVSIAPAPQPLSSGCIEEKSSPSFLSGTSSFTLL